jgi:hypothetical protein
LLYNASTYAVNLPVGSGGFYNPVANSGNHQEINAAPASAMQFIVRRNTSADRSPLYNRPWEQSDWINAFCLNGINITRVNAEFGTNSSHLIGDPSVAAQQITPQDLFTYQIQVSAHGDRTDWYNGGYNTPTTYGFYTTPDFSATAYTTAQQRDIIVQELTLDFNSKARMQSFAICVQSAAGNTTGSVLISDLGDGTTPVGTTVTIGYDKTGNAHSFVLTTEMAAAFAALDTRLTALGFATARMKPYKTLTTTGAPAGVPFTGTTTTCDMIYVMALDEGQAYYDYRMQSKTRIEVGLVQGFDNVPQEKITDAYEGSGYARQLAIAYRMTNGYEETHRATLPNNQNHVEFPNFIKSDGFYDYFVIEHCDTRSATSGMPNYNNFTTIIAVMNYTIGDATSNPYYDNDGDGPGVDNSQRVYILDSLNAFIADNNLNIPALT